MKANFLKNIEITKNEEKIITKIITKFDFLTNATFNSIKRNEDGRLCIRSMFNYHSDYYSVMTELYNDNDVEDVKCKEILHNTEGKEIACIFEIKLKEIN